MTRCACLASLAVALAIAVAACASAPRSNKAAPVSHQAEPPLLSGRPDEMRDRIRELDEQIQRDLAAWNIPAPSAEIGASMSATPMSDVRTTCEHVPSDRCNDVCKLSDSICTSAENICDLAAQLPGDAWASERCGAAKASCQRATDRCCTGECAAQP